MKTSNVQSSQGVTLVGAGAPKGADIHLLQTLAPTLVAADGGANTCAAHGLTPDTVIGDFDSLDPKLRGALPDTTFLHVAEQESTDFEKCLTRIEAPFVLATGFTAGRLDHTLATCTALVTHPGRPVIVLGTDDILFAAPDELTLNVAAETRVSLFPMAELTARSTGLMWPLDGLTLAPNGQIGTSNKAIGPITLSFDRPGCLIILPRAALETALAALTG